MDCPKCGKPKAQFRSKNNNTEMIKYKCLFCGEIFKIKESDIISEYII